MEASSSVHDADGTNSMVGQTSKALTKSYCSSNGECSGAQTEVWVQPACTDGAEWSTFAPTVCESEIPSEGSSEQVTTGANGSVDDRPQQTTTTFTSNDSGSMENGEGNGLSLNSFSRSYMSFHDLQPASMCTRSASRQGFQQDSRKPEVNNVETNRVQPEATASGRRLSGCVRSSHGEPERQSRGRWRQCFTRRQNDAEGQNAEIERLQGLLIAETNRRLRVEDENKRMQEHLDRYRKVVDIAFAQRKTCSQLLSQSMQEKQELERQLGSLHGENAGEDQRT